jgi:protein-S-isoprenylcysteine O-methyltransferase Ste14
MNGDLPAYGLWLLVVVNAGIFILFAFSFFKPKTASDWRTLAASSAFIATAWRVFHGAQREGRLATTGPYARLRHPQYAGFALIMIGFFLQWPTLVAGLMLPVLLVMYWRLARREEREVEAAFGAAYRSYAKSGLAFLSRWGGLSTRGPP